MRVDALLDQLSLRKAKDTRIGSATIKGISGGEETPEHGMRIFVTVAPLLFVDEATTGLSSADALAVMHILKGLSFRGHTILITIHQPRQDIVDMFDRILLLTGDGRLAFLGPPSRMVPHFESVCKLSCPARANTSDFALDALSAKDQHRTVSNEGFASAFSRTDMYKKMRDYVSGEQPAAGSSGANAPRSSSFNVEEGGAGELSETPPTPHDEESKDGSIMWEPADGSKIQHIRGPSVMPADHEDPPILPKRHAFVPSQLYS